MKTLLSRLALSFCAISFAAACASAPAPCPEAPAATEKAAAVKPGTADEMRRALAASMERGGFSCTSEKKGQVCGKNDFKIAPEAVVDDIPWVMLITSFVLTPKVSCEEALMAHVQIGSDLRMVCNRESGLATFFTQTMVPADGFADADILALNAWFKSATTTLAAIMLERGIIE